MGYVTFEDPVTGQRWRSDRDLGLIREKISVGSPQVIKKLISVPGMDGVHDFSRWLGRPIYGTRPLKISAGKTIVDRYEQDSRVKNALHGRQLRITDSDDPSFYYLGLVEVGEWDVQAGVGKVVISAECDPYKYRQLPTYVSGQVPESGTMTLHITNDRMLAVPTITSTAAATLAWQGRTFALSANKPYRDLDIELQAGINTMQIKAAPRTTITVEYQEGRL